jgi:hypothetical protein
MPQSNTEHSAQHIVEQAKDQVDSALNSCSRDWSALTQQNLERWTQQINQSYSSNIKPPNVMKVSVACVVLVLLSILLPLLLGPAALFVAVPSLFIAVPVMIFELGENQLRYENANPQYEQPAYSFSRAFVQADSSCADGVIVLSQGSQELLRLPLTGLSLDDKADLLLQVKLKVSDFNDQEQQRRQEALDSNGVGNPETIAHTCAAIKEQHRQATLLNALDEGSYAVLNREVEDIKKHLAPREQANNA